MIGVDLGKGRCLKKEIKFFRIYMTFARHDNLWGETRDFYGSFIYLSE